MTPHTSRRVFMLQIAAGSAAAAGLPAFAADAVSTVRLTEADPYAKSMGFRLDTNQVDQARYPRHDAATQHCSLCQLWSGKEGDEVGPCSFYNGRLVPPTGWCRNFKARKAAA
jgi:hypothetical protein